MPTLPGQIAIVAGATRGAGRGIARALGEAGATVYCTGRSTHGNPSPYARPETIEETAELVTAAGGTGIAVRVDHTIEREVEALMKRVESEQGRLDILVNSIAGEDRSLGSWTTIAKTKLDQAETALRQALLSHVITAKHAARLMIRAKRGLIVEVTEGDLAFGGGNVIQDLVKSGLKGLAVRLAEELHGKGITAVAVTPGFLRSERMLEHFGVTEENWRDGGARDPHFLQSETPLFLGRGVAALAADPDALAHTGDVLSSWELGRRYGVTDHDGRTPDWGEHFGSVVIPAPEFGFIRDGLVRHIAWLERMTTRARSYLRDPSTTGTDSSS